MARSREGRPHAHADVRERRGRGRLRLLRVAAHGRERRGGPGGGGFGERRRRVGFFPEFVRFGFARRRRAQTRDFHPRRFQPLAREQLVGRRLRRRAPRRHGCRLERRRVRGIHRQATLDARDGVVLGARVRQLQTGGTGGRLRIRLVRETIGISVAERGDVQARDVVRHGLPGERGLGDAPLGGGDRLRAVPLARLPRGARAPTSLLGGDGGFRGAPRRARGGAERPRVEAVFRRARGGALEDGAEGGETATRDGAVRVPARARQAERRPRAETPVRARRLARAPPRDAGGDGASHEVRAATPRLERGSRPRAPRDGGGGAEPRRADARVDGDAAPIVERGVREPGARPTRAHGLRRRARGGRAVDALLPGAHYRHFAARRRDALAAPRLQDAPRERRVVFLCARGDPAARGARRARQRAPRPRRVAQAEPGAARHERRRDVRAAALARRLDARLPCRRAPQTQTLRRQRPRLRG